MTGDKREQVCRTAGQRAAYRAFVRANHPDVGGDPAAFVDGIATFEVMASQRRRSTADRFDAPITVVVRPTGLRYVTSLLRRWWKRCTGPSRVR